MARSMKRDLGFDSVQSYLVRMCADKKLINKSNDMNYKFKNQHCFGSEKAPNRQANIRSAIEFDVADRSDSDANYLRWHECASASSCDERE